MDNSQLRRFAYVMLRKHVLSARQRGVLVVLATHVAARRKKEEGEKKKMDAVRVVLQTRTDAVQVLLRRALRHWCGWAADSSAQAQKYLACKDACMQELLYSQRQRQCAQLLAVESALARALAAWCVGMGRQELVQERRRQSFYSPHLAAAAEEEEEEEDEHSRASSVVSRVTTSREVINRLLGDVTNSQELVNKLLLNRALTEHQQSLNSALIEQ